MRRSLGPILLIFLGLALILAYLLLRDRRADGPAEAQPTAQRAESAGTSPALSATTPTVAPASTPQPIVPTPTEPMQASAPDPAPATSDTPAASNAPLATFTPDPRRCPLPNCLARSGVSGRLEDIAAAAGAGLPIGNFFDWWLNKHPPLIPGLSEGDPASYWQMVPVSQDGPLVPWTTIEEVVATRPGSIWIVGNEPDVAWQDNTTAETYAAIYHDVYTFIKDRDPSAQLAIAGVAQPSPLRFAYLEQVLDTYQALYGQPMPVDIWTVHAFILREQADSWGVGIPPGMDEDDGLLYEIADHDDLEIFQQSLASFRQWMAEHGYGDMPLAVTEFGILHPADYGFPPDAVIEFLIGASHYMATARGDVGFPEDDFRLVQYWFWYSTYDGGDFPTGNLYDPEDDRLTAVGQAYQHYLAPR